jgi:ABC-type glycerol-3-phosphate transport system permease component
MNNKYMTSGLTDCFKTKFGVFVAYLIISAIVDGAASLIFGWHLFAPLFIGGIIATAIICLSLQKN